MQLLLGNCVTVMKTMPESTIDAVITDPPYGLTAKKKGGSGVASLNEKSPAGRSRIGTGQGAGFMGMKWDHGVPGSECWSEVLRVAKPGAYLLAFGGTRTFHRLICAIEDAGWEIRDCIMWVYGSGFPKSLNVGGGRGTALKPAWEPIIVARKLCKGTVAENVQQYGTGALNIDACRIPGPAGSGVWGSSNKTVNPERTFVGSPDAADYRTEQHPSGRWPVNVIHDGSEDVLTAFPDAPGQQRAVGPEHGPKPSVHTCGDYGPRELFQPRDDSGSAARFFYCAKADRTDRNEGLEGEPVKPLNWSSGDQSPGTFQSKHTNRHIENFHPTVKPTALMRYLCRLVTPPNGIVLDPFMGSGSTGKAALHEGFDFIGIEIDPTYLALAKARIVGQEPLFRKEH
jgi:site-specific DNA-methyltransferase (adenine-specific)